MMPMGAQMTLAPDHESGAGVNSFAEGEVVGRLALTALRKFLIPAWIYAFEDSRWLICFPKSLLWFSRKYS